MPAAELSSMTKTNSVRTIWPISSGVIGIRHEDTKTRNLRCSSSCFRVFVVASVLMRGYWLPRSPARRQRAPAFPHVRFVLVSEVLQRRQHRRDGGVAEGAERFAGDVLGNALQEIEVAHLTLAALDLAKDLVEPVGAFPARRALAARLVTVEVEEI